MLNRPDAHRFRLVAAPFTAFDRAGSLDLSVVPDQVRRLCADGVAGAFVCGSTGEGASLTLEERRRVAEEWVRHADGLDVIVHVGHACLADAQVLAAHASRLEISGIAAVAPYYHRPAGVGELVGFCAEVAAAAPQTPFFYYHIPTMTGVALPMDEFLAAARSRIPTFAGIKFTHDDLGEFSRCLELAEEGSVEIMFGRDELLLPCLSLGGRVAVGSTYNFAAPLYHRLAEALAVGDLASARRAQKTTRGMIEVAMRHGGQPAFKALAGLVAVDCGPCRSPLRTLDAGARGQLRSIWNGSASSRSSMSRGADRTPAAGPTQMAEPVVGAADISTGLRSLGLDRSSAVMVHASLRSFGRVDGGAHAVCRALVETCGTVLMASGTWQLTGVPAPPGLVRPRNACLAAETWERFDEALEQAVPFSPDLPVDRWLGRIAEALRQGFAHERSTHPLFSFLAVGRHARRLVGAQRLDWPVGPIEELAEMDGHVLLLGVGHTSNTAIHLAEQRLGRSRFYRYAKAGPGAWMELPNISGESHRFDEIEPVLRPLTAQVRIGASPVRLVAVRDVLACATGPILDDPAALLCADPECRCGAALQQRLTTIRRQRLES